MGARMLAQGQSSSAKRGGLATVSSRLIFLKKKKKGKQISDFEGWGEGLSTKGNVQGDRTVVLYATEMADT